VSADLSVSASPRPLVSSHKGRWLFSAPVDLSVFLGSALLSFVALWVGARAGVLNNRSPDWTWVPAVLLIDVAHVWATGFRVYFDTNELKRRPWLYTLTPLLGLAIGMALYSESELLFWRLLAYLAVFHFVRQQYGWVMLYRARVGERDKFGRWLDSSAIYLATLYPLIYWHAHLPRQFWWFLDDDFHTLPGLAFIERVVQPVYWLVLVAYIARSIYCWLLKNEVNPGKDIVVLTTAVSGAGLLVRTFAPTGSREALSPARAWTTDFSGHALADRLCGRDVVGSRSVARPRVAVRRRMGHHYLQDPPSTLAGPAATDTLPA